ncbi:hypothetical protein THAOC_12637, partial [Thalassiosira oceanica]
MWAGAQQCGDGLAVEEACGKVEQRRTEAEGWSLSMAGCWRATYHKHQRHNRREPLELCGRKVQLQAESLHRCKLGSPAVHTTGGGHGWSQSDVYAL